MRLRILSSVAEESFKCLLAHGVPISNLSTVSGDQELWILIEAGAAWSSPSRHILHLNLLLELKVEHRAIQSERSLTEHPNIVNQVLLAFVLI